MRPAHAVICTVGTSLFRPNLAGLRADDPEPSRQGWPKPTPQPTGRLSRQVWVRTARPTGSAGPRSIPWPAWWRVTRRPMPTWFSALPRPAIGEILGLLRAGHPASGGITTDRDRGSLEAQGKAQIAIVGAHGPGLGVPVYYKHELFDEIIAFPPMPVAFDFEAWMRLSGLLLVLQADLQPATWSRTTLATLRPSRAWSIARRSTGRLPRALADRADLSRDLPRAVPDDPRPGLAASGPDGAEEAAALRGLGPHARGPRAEGVPEAVTAGVPQVVRCSTFWSHPDLPRPARFWVGTEGVEGQFSDGKALVKFRVETRATTRGQMAAVAATLNEWLQEALIGKGPRKEQMPCQRCTSPSPD